MLLLVSPAKTLDYSPTENKNFTQPRFMTESKKLISVLKKKSTEDLKKLMHISDKLAELNKQRTLDFTTPFTSENARPAVYTFDGDVYNGLDAYSLPEEKLDKLQDTLRILSGMYGILKPLDLMQAYRLEMGTKLKVGRKDNLYKYWGDTLTNHLNEELSDDELFINLASNEYFKAVQPKNLKVPVITPIFKDFKNDKLKVISFFAKKARGMMVRYIIDKDITTLEGLKGFDYEGYGFSSAHSDLDKNELVFIR